MMESNQTEKKQFLTETEQSKWYHEGYHYGILFALEAADYYELAAISRAGGIPPNWDIFRAEILNTHLGAPSFDFQAYAAGFARACMEALKPYQGALGDALSQELLRMTGFTVPDEAWRFESLPDHLRMRGYTTVSPQSRYARYPPAP